MYLHLHGQSRWHDDITIIGNREALTRLRYLIDTVLKQEAVNGISSASSSDIKDDPSFFSNDGEGYFADVVLLEDSDERWKALKLPYTDLEIIRPKDDDLVWNARKQDFERLDTYGSVTESMRETMQAKIGDWLLNGKTGISSRAMAAMALGSSEGNANIPLDTIDLSNCIELVKAVPEVLDALKMRINIEGELPVPKFSVLIIHWETIVKIYEEVEREINERKVWVKDYGSLPKFRYLIAMIELLDKGNLTQEDDLYAMAVQSVVDHDRHLYQKSQ